MQVTVVIPHYDDPRLEQALASVAAQTRPPDEVIVVDDGSPSPPTECRRVRVLSTLAPRSGPAVGRNLGVAAAHGDAVAFLDADDLFLPDKLARQVEAMERTGAAWSYTDCYYLGSKGRFRRPNSWFHGWPDRLPSGRDCQAAHLAGHNFITMSSVVVRREVAPTFNPLLPVSEDWDAFVRLAEAHEGVAVNEVLHLYRLNPAGGRHYVRLDRYVDTNVDILRRAYARLGLPIGSRDWRRAVARIRRRALIQRLNAGQSLAWRLLLRAFCGSWL